MIHRAAREYRDVRGRWPRDLVEIFDVFPPGEHESYPRDPWNGDYAFSVEKDDLVIRSLGRDRKPGGAGEDADLVSIGGGRVSEDPAAP